jgi:lipopolysaccharide/colanic/teichoic acid biosynthesis glycosyltransferase
MSRLGLLRERRQVHPVRRLAKRLIDIFVGIVALVVFFPLMVIEALVVWSVMGRPILFRQMRPGQNERLFEVVKFRTMLPSVDASGKPLSQADRVTRLGWFLRRTSLDELPQLLSVIRGDLSLVGPRPLLCEYLSCYTQRERLRHSVPPGFTGLAQINGRNLLSWEERLELDVQYVERWSLLLDFQIIAKTFLHLFKSDGVTRDPNQEGTLNVIRIGQTELGENTWAANDRVRSVVSETSSSAPPWHVQAPGGQ